MRVGVISDIHGNLVAFEAVWHHLSQQNLDQVICLGDVAVAGPQPHEMMQKLMELDLPIVMGNADAVLLDPALLRSHVGQFLDIFNWNQEQLTDDDVDFVKTFQPTLEVDVDGLGLLCFHGSPQSNLDIILAATSDEEMQTYFGDVDATLVMGGHTHVALLKRWEDKIFVNPGSVGLPCFKPPFSPLGQFAPYGEYAIISHEQGNLDIQLMRIPLDVKKIQQSALDANMAHAEAWASQWT